MSGRTGPGNLISRRRGLISDDLFCGSTGEAEEEKEKDSPGHGGMQHGNKHITDALVPAEKQISNFPAWGVSGQKGG